MTDPIKARIQELCDDVMELKFGCHVIVRGIREDNPGCEHDVVVDERIKDGKITLGYFGQVPLDEIEILGSKITIAVVLRAIEEAATLYNIRADSKYDYRKHSKQGDSLVSDVDVGNGNYVEYGSIELAKLLRLWNLEHDNYDQQSQECKQFIGGLLGITN